MVLEVDMLSAFGFGAPSNGPPHHDRQALRAAPVTRPSQNISGVQNYRAATLSLLKHPF